MLINRFLILVFLLFSLTGLEKVWGQVYTTTGNSADWNNAAAWTRNDTGCAVNNGGPPPPTFLNQGNACSVKIIINHPITITGNRTFGGGYMDSLIVNAGGNLTITGNLDVTNTGFQASVGAFSFTVRGGGIFNVNGNFNNQNGASIRVQSAGSFNIGGNYNTTGSSSSLSIDATSSLSVIGSTTINSNHTLVVSGSYTTNTLNTGSGGTIAFNNTSNISVLGAISHSNGSITVSNTANLIVGGNFDMSGSAALNVSGDSDIKVSGNLNFANGTINNSSNGDIRVDGNLTMSGGGTYNGSNNSYIQVNGNHVISANNPVNLSGDSKFVTVGNRTGGVNLSISGNACYNSLNFLNSLCLACSTGYTSNGSFFVPDGVTQITIEMWGGGARGGNAQNNRRGGGGGGAYSRITINVTPGEALGVFVGSGGDQMSANGGTTYITRDSSVPLPERITNSILFANGGQSTSTTTGSQGGLVLTAGELAIRPGSVSFRGGNGANSGTDGGGGGSSAGTSLSSTNATTRTGAVAPNGGGNGGNGSNANNGSGVSDGISPGGGGGGGRSNNSNIRNGGNGASGYVLISYNCPSNTACSRILDFGTDNGFTVIEYFCLGVWNAPEGLEEFSVTAIGGGGGGGFGSSSGGGGAGAIVTQTFQNINRQPANPPTQPTPIRYGLPAGTNFTVFVGNGETGATSSAQQGSDGSPSSVSGTFINYANTSVSLTTTATGGGGGGTSSTNAMLRNGRQGGSGGGGATISGQAVATGGSIGGSGSRNEGATARNGTNSTFQGGGGGGAGGQAPILNASNNNGGGQSFGGVGGPGTVSGVPGVSTIFSGGGGGTASGASNNFPGAGGVGGGGAADPTGVGLAGSTNTGSGGGAGSSGGGKGGSGRVYIYYQNFRILPLEYLYFNVNYLRLDRIGELTWATAKEWENSHFEIERSVNDTRNWTKVGEVTGKGYSDVAVEYSFTDLNLPASGGNIFYRLKQIDLDGDFQFSVTRAIRVEALNGSTSWIVYPNPSAMGSTVTVDLLDKSGFADESILIRISDARGIFESYSVSSPEEVSAVVNSYLDQARPGLHILQLIWGSKSEQIKLIRK